jgi:hypothetical protein
MTIQYRWSPLYNGVNAGAQMAHITTVSFCAARVMPV